MHGCTYVPPKGGVGVVDMSVNAQTFQEEEMEDRDSIHLDCVWSKWRVNASSIFLKLTEHTAEKSAYSRKFKSQTFFPHPIIVFCNFCTFFLMNILLTIRRANNQYKQKIG